MRAPTGTLQLSRPDDVGIVRGAEIGIACVDVNIVGNEAAEDRKLGPQRISAFEDIAQSAPLHRLLAQPVDRRKLDGIDAEVPHVDEGLRLPYYDERGFLVTDEVVYCGAQHSRQFGDDLVALDAEPDDEVEDDGSEGAETHRVDLDVDRLHKPLHESGCRAVDRSVEQQGPGPGGNSDQDENPEEPVSLGQDSRLEIHIEPRHAKHVQEGDDPEDDVQRGRIEDGLVFEYVRDQGDVGKDQWLADELVLGAGNAGEDDEETHRSGSGIERPPRNSEKAGENECDDRQPGEAVYPVVMATISRCVLPAFARRQSETVRMEDHRAGQQIAAKGQG